MKLILIYGVPAVGKLSVAKKISKLSGYKNFHNHLSIELARSLFEFRSKNFYDYSDDICYDYLRRAAKNGINLIMTFCYNHPDGGYFMRKVIRIINKNGGKICFVHLHASKNELIKRVSMKSRIRYNKITSKKVLLKLLKEYDFQTSFKNTNTLLIDNTKLSVKDTARAILHHFNITH